MVGSNELLYFADICAGPGGFSEYVLWRRKGECKGFGMTLKGQNDFKLEDFFAGPSEMFEPHYGVGGLHGDGDIFRPDNQEAFINFVRRNSDGKGVHFVMADGGFSVEGQENIQEILSKQLVGLVYLMRLIFDSVCIFKPVTSRPANSERYIVCKGLRANCKPVIDYMDAVNRDLCSCSSTLSETDVNHIVDQDVMLDDAAFFTYIYNSNVKLGKRQILNLRKIQAFAQNVLEMMKVKGYANQLRLCFLSHTGNYFHPTGIDLIKTVKEPWSMALSKKAGRKYWFNKRMPNSSTFDCHAECIATFRDSKLSSLRWNWSPGVKVHDSQQHISDALPSRDDFVRYIMEKK
nr:hypothetical protein BaRGS_006839 [Batillaria attramentaria]